MVKDNFIKLLKDLSLDGASVSAQYEFCGVKRKGFLTYCAWHGRDIIYPSYANLKRMSIWWKSGLVRYNFIPPLNKIMETSGRKGSQMHTEPVHFVIICVILVCAIVGAWRTNSPYICPFQFYKPLGTRTAVLNAYICPPPPHFHTPSPLSPPGPLPLHPHHLPKHILSFLQSKAEILYMM